MPPETAAPAEGSSIDPLIALGLIDPKLIDSEPGTPVVDSLEESQQPADTKADPKLAELQGKLTALEAQLAQAQAGPQRTLEQDLAFLDSKANEALAVALADPRVVKGEIAPEVVRALLQSEHGRLAAETRAYHDRIALRPAAVEAAAQKIAREMSTPQVKLTAKDLSAEPTVEAMQARARVLVETGRDTKFAARTARGADRVEGGAHPGAVSQAAIDSLDPFNKIKLGLKRGG